MRRRRSILGYLVGAERGRATLAELVDHVVEAAPRSERSDRGAVATILYHTHLPKLADEGLVDYDRTSGTITTTGQTGRAEPYLGFVRNREGEPREGPKRK